MLYFACALAPLGAGAADSAAVESSSATRLENVLSSIRARDTQAGPVLAARFDGEPVASIRAWLIRGAAVLKAPQGPALFRRAMTGDANPLVRSAAAQALAQTEGAGAAADLGSALAAERSSGVRNTIVFWLGTIKTPEAAAALQRTLSGDSSPNVRAQAARGLRRHGTAGAKQAVKGARKDKDARVRAIADEP